MLPFSHAEFVDLFARYNLAIWPAQLLAYIVAAAMLAMLVWSPTQSGRFAGVGLALMWGWTGIAYHWMQFTLINKAAWAFGGLFVLQALLFFYAAITDRLNFEGSVAALRRWVGWFLVVYATVLYPVLGMAAGSTYTHLPVFGVTPCPVTIFTFGVLVLSTTPVPRWLLVIPVVWSLVGGSAAFLLHVPQDWVLLLAGVSVFLMARKTATAPAPGYIAG
jgi:hypothetical protein